MFSPIPFVEKGIIALVKVSNRILATYRPEKVSEELRHSPVKTNKKILDLMAGLKLVLFAIIDDLHEKMPEYSRRENAEKETRSMEGTLTLSMELLTNVYLHLLKPISESPGFKTHSG
ncbi:hypothetical protein AgCh_027035 [Apium graveolens]